MPLMNYGFRGRLPEQFQFRCGAQIKRGCPKLIWEGLSRRSGQRTSFEKTVWVTAGGWMWLTSDEEPGALMSERNCFDVCHVLTEKIRQLYWFINLCGGGENDFWGYGNNLRSYAIYVISDDFPSYLKTERFTHLYSIPTEAHQNNAWSNTVLERADALEQSVAKLPSVHPRIVLANELLNAACSYDVRRQRIRFQLVISALETLLIAPSERNYLWCDPAKTRLRQVCPSRTFLTDEFFMQLQERRHNAVHRGGLDRTGASPKIAKAEVHVESTLRDALCWALINAEALGPCFERDAWPTSISALGWEPAEGSQSS